MFGPNYNEDDFESYSEDDDYDDFPGHYDPEVEDYDFGDSEDEDYDHEGLDEDAETWESSEDLPDW